MTFVEIPKWNLRLKNAKQFELCSKDGVIDISDSIGKDFFISKNHFSSISRDDWLSDDLTWGFTRNILFTVNGYCDFWKSGRENTLSLRVEDIY